MTREDAIKGLEGLSRAFGGYKPNEEMFEMAIAALKKEIAKPISIENGFVKCGSCGMYLRYPIMDHYNNCPECGQKILWKGESE